MTTSEVALVSGISLYPDQWAFIEETADALGLQGKKRRSPAIQFILRDYKRLREAEHRFCLAISPIQGISQLTGEFSTLKPASSEKHAEPNKTQDQDCHPEPCPLHDTGEEAGPYSCMTPTVVAPSAD